MLNLIWKDLEVAKRLLPLVLPLGILQLAITASVGPVFIFAALAFSALLAWGLICIEEMQRTEILWNSLPLTRDQIVGARYLSVLLGILAGLSLSWATAQGVIGIIPATGAMNHSPFLGLYAHTFLFAILTLTSAMSLPFCFRFGAGRGAILFTAVAVGALLTLSVLMHAIVLAAGYSHPFLDPEAWTERGPALLLEALKWMRPRMSGIIGLAVAVSISAMILSFLVSKRLYETRDL